jgi:hypothetical protein
MEVQLWFINQDAGSWPIDVLRPGIDLAHPRFDVALDEWVKHLNDRLLSGAQFIEIDESIQAMDSKQDADLVAVGCIDSLESHVRQQVVHEFAEGPPGVDQSTPDNLTLTIDPVAKCLKTVNLNLAERMLEIVGGLVISPRIAVSVKDADALNAGDALA